MSLIVLGIAAVHFVVPIVVAAGTDSRGKTWLFGIVNLVATVVIGAGAYSILDFVSASFGLYVALAGLPDRKPKSSQPDTSSAESNPSPAATPSHPPPPTAAPTRASTPPASYAPARPLPGLPHVSVRNLSSPSASALSLPPPGAKQTGDLSVSPFMRAMSPLALAVIALAFWKGSRPTQPAPMVNAPSTPSSTPSPRPPQATTVTAALATAAAPQPRPQPAVPHALRPARVVQPPATPTAPVSERRQVERCLRLADDAKVQRCLEALP